MARGFLALLLLTALSSVAVAHEGHDHAPAPAPGLISPGPDDAVVSALKGFGLSVLADLLAPLGPANLITQAGQPITLFAPIDHAFSFNNATLKTVEIALRNDSAYTAFATNLLKYHIVVGKKIKPALLKPNDEFKSFLGAPVYYSDQVLTTGSIEPVNGLASSLTNVTSWAFPQGPARSVPSVPNLAIIVIDRLLYPADVDLLFDGVVQDNSYTFGTNPPLPTFVNNASAPAQVDLFNQSYLFQLSNKFSTIISLLDQFKLTDALVNISLTSGVTFFVPSDQAILNTAPTFLLAKKVFDNDTYNAWLYNLLLQHVVPSHSTQADLIKTSQGLETLLGTLIRTANADGSLEVYTWPKPVPLNYSAATFPVLNIDQDVHLSMIGVDDVILPYNASRLLPPSAIPQTAEAPSGSPSGSGSPSSGPKGAASVVVNAVLLLVLAFVSLIIMV